MCALNLLPVVVLLRVSALVRNCCPWLYKSRRVIEVKGAPLTLALLAAGPLHVGRRRARQALRGRAGHGLALHRAILVEKRKRKRVIFKSDFHRSKESWNGPRGSHRRTCPWLQGSLQIGNYSIVFMSSAFWDTLLLKRQCELNVRGNQGYSLKRQKPRVVKLRWIFHSMIPYIGYIFQCSPFPRLCL